ncbi:MAG: PAS domain-containing protein [Bacteroidales bacterium]|nr:PAS domain-containing protein [Bacteroidales bacterium]
MKNQKNIEQSQQTIKFYETLLRVSNDGILITDASRNIIEVNDAFCSFIGQKRKVIIGSDLFKWLDMFSEDAAENWIKLEKAVQSKQVVSNYEIQLLLNNEIRYFDVKASLLEKIENEEQGHIISNWHDITERKKAEEALQGSEKKYRNLVENIEEGIASVDESEKFIYVNPATTKIFGYSEKELLNMTLKDFTTPEEFQKITKQTSIRKN